MIDAKKLIKKWDLSPLFLNDNDPQMAKKRKLAYDKSYEFIDKWKNRTDYLVNIQILRQALDEYEEWMRLYAFGASEMYYFDLRTSQDENDTHLKALYSKIEEFTIKIQNDIQFFTLKISKVPVDFQKKALEAATLSPYKHFLEILFEESAHILSDKEEKVLNLKSITSYSNWIKLTSGFLAKTQREIIDENGRKAIKSFTEILGALESRSKKTRDSAGGTIHSVLRENSDLAEAEINSVLMNKKTDDELRGFKRPDASRHLGDDIEPDVVDTVITAVSKRFDISRRYYKLKAKLLGLKQLKYHERNIPIGDVEKKYTYEDSVLLVDKVFRKLDPEFASIFASFVKKGQIDVYPQKGKRSGAFCSHYLHSLPTFILLNHTDKLTDVLTLAHEVGHGINNELCRQQQNALNFGTPTSTAEVASTFMEDFVLEELLSEADDNTKLAVLIKKLNDDVSSIFRQIAAYQFELDLHKNFREKGYLSKEEIGGLFQHHMADYMGPAIEQSPGSENWWVYWNHIRYFFYVYSYASGLLISKSLQSKVRLDPKFIGKVKEFLSAGKSASPKRIFANLGIDITRRDFWESGLQEVDKLLSQTEDLANKIKKI